MKRLEMAVLLFIAPTLLLAQFRSNTGAVNIPAALQNVANAGKSAVGAIGLDPSRLSIYHSYTMEMMSMGSGRTMAVGTYLNTLHYEFSIPMSVTLQWGIMHQPMAGANQMPFVKSGPFLSAARLLYEPTKNTKLQIEFRQNPYGYRYGYSPYWMSRDDELVP